MKREYFFFVVFVIFIIVILILATLLLLPFIKPIMWAVFLATALWPLRNLINKRIRSKTLTSLILSILVLITIILPVSILAGYTFRELTSFTSRISSDSLNNLLTSYINILTQHPVFKGIEIYIPDIITRTNSYINEMLIKLSAYIKDLIVQTGSVIIDFAIFLFTLFFILKEGDSFYYTLKASIPIEKQEKEKIFATIRDTIIAVIYGTIGTAFIQSLTALIVFMVFGIPYAFLLGFLTFFASFIPPLGASYVWLPVSIYLIKTSSFLKFALFFISSLAFVSSIDNIARPILIRNKLSLPYVILFFSFFGGITKFGFIGIFLGPLVFALLSSLFKILREKYLENTDIMD